MKKFDSINVIPFIDIMLVLLAIVLTTATFVANGHLDIDLPTSSSTEAPNTDETVEIAMNHEGSVYVNSVEMPLDQAEHYLRQLSTDTTILLLMDETVEFKRFVEIIDILKRLSLDRVSVLTRMNN